MAAGNVPFTFTHPFADQVGTADTEKGTVRLCRYSLGEVTFTRSWRTVQQDTLPRLSLALEQTGELDGENNSLLQRLLRTLKTSDILPPHVGPLLENSTRQRVAQLLAIVILTSLRLPLAS